MKVVPQTLCQADSVVTFAHEGQSAILYKNLPISLQSEEMYISAHTLTIVTQGEKHLITYDGKVFEIPHNRVAFFPKDVYVISDLIPQGKCFESYLFFFDDAIIESFLASCGKHVSLKKERDIYMMEYTPAIKAYVENLQPLFSAVGGNSGLLNIKLLEILQLMSLADESGGFASWLYSIMRRNKRNLSHFMQTHYDKPLSVEDYAYLTGRSLSTFLRDFKAQFGTTPKKWLNDKRLEKAHDLMHEKDISVTEAAQETGYENISHFIKMFKQKYTLSPKQFIMQNRQ